MTLLKQSKINLTWCKINKSSWIIFSHKGNKIEMATDVKSDIDENASYQIYNCINFYFYKACLEFRITISSLDIYVFTNLMDENDISLLV